MPLTDRLAERASVGIRSGTGTGTGRRSLDHSPVLPERMTPMPRVGGQQRLDPLLLGIENTLYRDFCLLTHSRCRGVPTEAFGRHARAEPSPAIDCRAERAGQALRLDVRSAMAAFWECRDIGRPSSD